MGERRSELRRDHLQRALVQSFSQTPSGWFGRTESVNLMKTITTLLLLALTAVSLTADEFSRWTWRVPSPPSIVFRHVVFAEGQFVAVGFEGAVITSTNGTNWFLEESVTTNVLHRIMHGERYVASGNYGTVIASTNGKHWHLGNYVNHHLLLAVAYGNETYLALDASGTFARSPDALAWTLVEPPASGGGADMIYGGGWFVAVGIAGMILTSTNGLDWVERESGTTGSIHSIAYGDGRFVAVGNEGGGAGTGFILTSFDAITWFLQSVDTYLKDVTFADGRFVIVGGGIGSPGNSLSSSDGLYFGEAEGGNGLTGPVHGVACGNGVCVAVGDGVFTSDDGGLTWSNVNSGTLETMYAFAERNGTVVGVGTKGTIITTTNGVDWIDQQFREEVLWLEVCAGDYGFAAVGTKAGLATSTDGYVWTEHEGVTTGNLRAIAYGGGRYVAVATSVPSPAYGYFVISDGGMNWEERRPFANRYINSSIAYGAGRFVAAGYDGQYFTSTDGFVWDQRSFGVPEQVVPIYYLNEQFIAFGLNKMLTSTDGLDWTVHPTEFSHPYRVAYGNGVYLGVRSTAPDVLFSFTDATNWKPEKIGRSGLYSAIYAYDSFLVGGTVIQSQSSLIPNLERVFREGGALNAEVFGRIGRNYELQSSGNLTDWDHEQDYTQSARHHPLTLPTGPDQRFYRVKLKEP
jgi:hypothetical protein